MRHNLSFLTCNAFLFKKERNPPLFDKSYLVRLTLQKLKHKINKSHTFGCRPFTVS